MLTLWRESLEFKNTNNYFFWLRNIAYVNFNLGDGSLKKGDYTNDKDSHRLEQGLDNLFKPVHIIQENLKRIILKCF